MTVADVKTTSGQFCSTGGQKGNRPRQSLDSGIAALKAVECMIRELDWASPKRPGRGVPPPRSGPPPPGAQ
jgi:hypothetical protein